MATITIWHNPRCSKSRQTLALLNERDIEPDVVEYLKTPPTADEILAVLAKLGIPAQALLRKKEATFKELGLDADAMSDHELAALMAEHPVLIERPVVIKGSRAVLGRPPEDVLALVD